MRDENQAITGVVMVATDQTQLVAAQKQAEQEKAHVSMILKLIKQKRQISKFVGEASKLLLHLEGVLNCPSQPQNEIFRALHTLKGASAFFSIQPVVDACHNAEEQLRWGDLKQCAEWVKVAKVAFQKFLDEAQALIGPLSETEGEKIELRVKDLTEYSQTFLEKGSPSAKEFFRRFLFKQPSEFFKPYNEPLQELAGRLNKSLQPLHVTPPNFSLLCQPYELLFQEFIHAFRNSLDHGIEPPEERIAQGKMPEGQIRIHFEKQHKPPAKPRLKIMIQDDGRGIDPKRVREKLTQKGIHSDHLSDQEVLQFVLSPQFSTKDTVSEISGRGVGLDALTAQVNHLKGRIWVESIPGQGTQIFMELPWIDDLDLSNCLAKAS
jgi:two-component system chemotaxis sensor kinase CheA